MSSFCHVELLHWSWRMLKRIGSTIPITVVYIATFPYYRVYHFYTIDPVRKIALLSAQDQESQTLLRAISLWRSRKLSELQISSISCAILAAAVIGAFSWTTVEEAYWLTHGFWHGSLVLAIFGVLLSASEITLLNLVGPLPSYAKRGASYKHAIQRYEPLLLSKTCEGWKPRRKMVFAWQCPMMFMSYSACAFIVGLTLLVCAPLVQRNGEWNAGCNIAIMYLTICATAATTFFFCTFWIYHYVDIDFDDRFICGDGTEDDGNGLDISSFSTQGAVAAGAMLERLEGRMHLSADGRSYLRA